MGGYTSWHAELERGLAALKGTEDCLLFPTGFAANLAVASALCQDGGVVVLSDELNHASIVDGARLGRRGGSRLLVYRHNDLAHLEQLLTEQVPPGGRAHGAARLKAGPAVKQWMPALRACCAACAQAWRCHPLRLGRVVARWAHLLCLKNSHLLSAPCALLLPAPALQACARWSSQTACSVWTATLPTCGAWHG